jgi:hypothetical protein
MTHSSSGLASAQLTAIDALSGLAVPVQLSCTGVSVYTHEPVATPSSVQVVEVTTPLQPAPTVAGAPFEAL